MTDLGRGLNQDICIWKLLLVSGRWSPKHKSCNCRYGWIFWYVGWSCILNCFYAIVPTVPVFGYSEQQKVCLQIEVSW